MSGRTDEKGSKDELKLDDFFVRLLAKEEQREVNLPYRLQLQRIRERQRVVKEHFSHKNAFDKYVKAHPLRSLIQQKVAKELNLHRFDLARVKEKPGMKPIKDQPPLEQYRALVDANYVDPSYVFPEFPGIAHLCELKNLSDVYLKINNDRNTEEQQIIREEWNRAIAYFWNRWYALTGEQLHGPPFPPVSKLTQLIAPVPFSSSWSEELYGREARSMDHAPISARSNEQAASNPADTENGGGSASHADDSSNANAGASSEVIVPGGLSAEIETSEEPSEAEERSDGRVPGTLRTGCDAKDIYRLAGGSRLRQPRPGQERYTFPGTLYWGEDIFYDYAVMVPVTECDIPEEIVSPNWRSLEAAMLSARFAKGLLNFLSTQQLEGALGDRTADPMHSLLDSVLSMQLGASAEHIRVLRKMLREKAALCRSLSRTRAFFIPSGGVDPIQYLAALDKAVNEFPTLKINDRHVPSTSSQERDAVKRTLQLFDTNPTLPPEDGIESSRSEGPGEFSPPRAINQSEDAWDWIYRNHVQQGRLTRYIQYLGGTLYTKLDALYDSARMMRDAVDQYRGQRMDVFTEFGRLAEEVVHEVLLALGRLFDDIAEQLPLPPMMKGEGSKRLALMLVFRQHWFPEGYVAGKLVGYKNLLPTQAETLKRRTFLKTTREDTTVQEFATAREQDFSHSTKETAELVREASSQFNFSVSVEGGFDILIASGDITTETQIDHKDLSKAMHSRVAEATMKSSMKHNEKREVKVRELSEMEDVQEVTTELQNLNREITANYFYYQLHRQYFVSTELAYVRPVLLRVQEVPHPATIDEKFLANHAHVLLHALPRQLSVDLQETVGDIEPLGRTLVRRRSDLDQKRAMFEVFRKSPMPSVAEEQSRWRTQLEALERAVSDANTAYTEAEETYFRARTRFDRVASHVRENICYYMQFIWHASPKVDQDKLLQEETFNGRPLAEVTRGFMRMSYFGDEEIFEYTGPSLECLNTLMNNLIAGYQIVSSLTDEQLLQHPLFQRLKRYYPADTDEMIVERIRAQLFVRDPVSPEEVYNTRRVQVAQDALVVEAMPGQVPLLEGFQMAHRMLDVQKACLENAHLAERINDRPWQQDGEDVYKVFRREGEAGEEEKAIDVAVSTPTPPVGP